MPIHAEKAPERATIPAGKHVLKLTAIKPLEQDNTFEPPLIDEDGSPILKPDGSPAYPIRKQFIWQFESQRLDPAGRPYEYAIFTPRYYNAKSDKNKLTLLLRMLLPELDDDERAELDYEGLIGRTYESQIIMAPNQRGTMRPQHTYFRELEAKPNFDPDHAPDTFDCPNCGQLSVSTDEYCPSLALPEPSPGHTVEHTHSRIHLHTRYVPICTTCNTVQGWPR